MGKGSGGRRSEGGEGAEPNRPVEGNIYWTGVSGVEDVSRW